MPTPTLPAFFISFAGPDSCLGAALIRASSGPAAVGRAVTLGLKPPGTVQALAMLFPESGLIESKITVIHFDRFYTVTEAEQVFGGGVMPVGQGDLETLRDGIASALTQEVVGEIVEKVVTEHIRKVVRHASN